MGENVNQDPSCVCWKKCPVRRIYRIGLNIMNLIRKDVPDHLVTGRGETAYEKGLEVFSKEFFDYKLFIGFIKIRTGRPTRSGSCKPIIWKTTPSYQYANFGTALQLDDHTTSGYPPQASVPLHEERDPLEGLDICAYTKDIFWSMLGKSRSGSEDTYGKLFVGTLFRKFGLHWLWYCGKNGYKSKGRIFTSAAVASYLWNTYKEFDITGLFDSQKQLQDTLKNHLFWSKSGETSEIGMQFFMNEYGNVDSGRSDCHVFQERCWTAALDGCSVLTVKMLWNHLSTGQPGIFEGYSMKVIDVDQGSTVIDEPMDLQRLMQDSFLQKRISKQAIWSLIKFRLVVHEQRRALALVLATKGGKIPIESGKQFNEKIALWNIGKRTIDRHPRAPAPTLD